MRGLSLSFLVLQEGEIRYDTSQVTRHVCRVNPFSFGSGVSIMATSVQDLLQSFEGLSDDEKKEVASEMIRRLVKFDLPPLSDQELVLSAEELFLELDKRESQDE
jgi:hypothetical protein